MNKQLYILSLILISLNCNAAKRADSSPLSPSIWYKPDTIVINPFLCNTILPTESYTMMMVYKSLGSDTIQPLWTLCLNDSTIYSVVSEKHIDRPIIYTMQHTIALDTTHVDSSYLYLGAKADTISHIQLYEAAYFPSRLTRRQSLMFQTYLALRYGITLHKSNYISSQGDIIWNARKHKKYYHHIQGIGTDPFHNYWAVHSVSSEDSLLMLFSVDTLSPFSYALIGDNGLPAEWTPWEGTHSILQRKWFLHTTGQISHLSIKLYADKLSDLSDTIFLALLSEENQVVALLSPTSTDTCGGIWYELPAYDTRFSFVSRFEHRSSHISGRKPQTYGDSEASIFVMPNPTHGKYEIDIVLPTEMDVILSIHDSTGKMVLQQSLTSSTAYHVQDYLSSSGMYFITVFDNKHNILATRQLLVY